MSKVGLIIPANLKISPYVYRYIEILDENNIEYDLLVWNRNGIESGENIFNYATLDKDIFNKSIGFIKFTRFVKKKIKTNHYKTIISFTLMSSILLSNILIRNFKNNFILDVRDDSILRKIFKHKIGKLVNSAKLVVISSPEYNRWFNNKGIVCHNIETKELYKKLEEKIVTKSDKIKRITYAGMMIEGEINQKLIDSCMENDLFELNYYGPITGEMKLLSDRNNGKNIHFYGPYEKSNIYNIYKQNSTFVNILRHESQINRDALPNKLYEAILSGKPIISFKHNTAIAFYCSKYNLGILLNDEEDLKDITKLNYKMNYFNYEEFNKGRILFLSNIQIEMEIFKKKVYSIVKK